MDKLHKALKKAFEGRKPANPNDQWSALTPDLTKEQLQELNEMAMEEAVATYHHEIEYITCNNCGYAPKCPLVFDLYNTNGDCLMDK